MWFKETIGIFEGIPGATLNLQKSILINLDNKQEHKWFNLNQAHYEILQASEFIVYLGCLI